MTTLVLATGAVAEVSPELAKSRRTLAEIERRIEETSADLAEKRRHEAGLLEDLSAVEAEQKRLGGRIDRLNRQLPDLERSIVVEETKAGRLKNSLSTLDSLIRQRLSALYKSGGDGLLRVLFSASSPAKMAEDYDFLGRIIRHDRDLLENYRKQLADREMVLSRLSELRREQQQALANSREEEKTLRSAGSLKKLLLAELRGKRQALSDELAELRERAARLSGLVKKLESQKTSEYSEKSGLFAQQKGRLTWPANGPVSVPFGPSRHPQLGTLQESQGIEIACGVHQPVAAVWSGRVIYANAFKGFGNLLIIDHGDSYYSLYAQTDRLNARVGDLVTQRETVAWSGFDGKTNLYFEIRHSGTPLNPQDWLAPR